MEQTIEVKAEVLTEMTCNIETRQCIKNFNNEVYWQEVNGVVIVYTI